MDTRVDCDGDGGDEAVSTECLDKINPCNCEPSGDGITCVPSECRLLPNTHTHTHTPPYDYRILVRDSALRVSFPLAQCPVRRNFPSCPYAVDSDTLSPPASTPPRNTLQTTSTAWRVTVLPPWECAILRRLASATLTACASPSSFRAWPVTPTTRRTSASPTPVARVPARVSVRLYSMTASPALGTALVM
jgi:hypothetical protein